MERLVCIELSAFALQILLRRTPEWREHTVVVVAEDRPNAEILEVNERARAKCILPGVRYAAALSIDRDVRAGVVAPEELIRAGDELGRRLQNFSPRVEEDPDRAGVFWVSARGLGGLYDSVNVWVEAIQMEVALAGFDARLCSGFSRFGTWAVARARPGVTLFRTPEEEQACASLTPLKLLELDPSFRDSLTQLGVITVGDFCALPPNEVRVRYGAGAAALHLRARGDLHSPLESWSEESPPRRAFEFESALRSTDQLLFVFKGALPPLLAILQRRSQGVHAIDFALTVELRSNRQLRERAAKPAAERTQRAGERREEITECVQTADASLNEELLVDLLRLRLEQVVARGPILAATLTLTGAPIEAHQHELFSLRTRRRPADAEQGLARVRAELGEDAVRFADIGSGHLPDAQARWRGCPNRLALPDVRETDHPTLIRRIFARPILLESPSRQPRNDGWLIRGERTGPVTRLLGPYVVSGGWWHVEVKRSYHYAETASGDILWVYFDHVRGQWFQHGAVR